jgi:hypothetical protein
MFDDRAASISDAARSIARHGGIAPTRWKRLTLGDSVAVLGHFAHAFGRETSKTVLANVARAWRGDREGQSRWVQAPRQTPSAALPERELGMTLALSAGLLVALLHNQHSNRGLLESWRPVWTQRDGVPIG